MAQASESQQRAISRGEGRDALCAALARIVARDGLDGVTFRSVAAEAGVTHGLASYHFGNRETMIIEALTWAVRESIQRGRLGEDTATLGEFAADVPALMAEEPQEAVFQFQLALEGQRRPELLAQVRATYDEYVSRSAGDADAARTGRRRAAGAAGVRRHRRPLDPAADLPRAGAHRGGARAPARDPGEHPASPAAAGEEGRRAG